MRRLVVSIALQPHSVKQRTHAKKEPWASGKWKHAPFLCDNERSIEQGNESSDSFAGNEHVGPKCAVRILGLQASCKNARTHAADCIETCFVGNCWDTQT